MPADWTIELEAIVFFLFKKQQVVKCPSTKKHCLFSNSFETILGEAEYKLKNSLYTACKTKNTESLLELLAKTNSPDSNTSGKEDQPSHLKVLNEAFGENRSTLLHLVAVTGFNQAIEPLLLAGADPSVK